MGVHHIETYRMVFAVYMIHLSTDGEYMLAILTIGSADIGYRHRIMFSVICVYFYVFNIF